MNQSTAAAICHAADGIIIRVNSEITDVLGYAPHELIGQHVQCLFDVNQREAYLSNGANYTQLNLVGSTPMRARHLNGEEIVVAVTVSELISNTAQEFLLQINTNTLAKISEIDVTPPDSEAPPTENHLGEELFRGLYDHSAVGMAVCNLAGRFVSVNTALCNYTGYREDELLARTFMDITHPEDVETNVTIRNTLLENSCDAFQLEKRYIHKNGRIIWALIVVSIVRDTNNQPIYSIGQMLNIDTLKQTEQELRRSRESLASAQRLAQLGDWELDFENGAVNLSDEAFRILGLDTNGNKVGCDFLISKLHPDDQARIAVLVDWAKIDDSQHELNCRYMMSDGSEKVVHVIGSLVCDPEGCPIRMIGTMQDITERCDYENTILQYREQVQRLAAHNNLMIEAERKRIAQDVHDEIGQLLTVLKIDMQLCKASTPEGSSLREKAKSMLELIELTIAAARDVTHFLRPPALNIGLIPAIEWLVQDIASRTELNIFLNVEPIEPNIDDAVATAIFRVTQESITNIIRHAAATEVVISLNLAEASLWLQIRDNGCGFIVDNASRSDAFGLIGIRERILALGGVFEIESELGVGTTLDIEVPVGT